MADGGAGADPLVAYAECLQVGMTVGGVEQAGFVGRESDDQSAPRVGDGLGDQVPGGHQRRTSADSSTGRAILVPRWRTLLADAP